MPKNQVLVDSSDTKGPSELQDYTCMARWPDPQPRRGFINRCGIPCMGRVKTHKRMDVVSYPLARRSQFKLLPETLHDARAKQGTLNLIFEVAQGLQKFTGVRGLVLLGVLLDPRH